LRQALVIHLHAAQRSCWAKRAYEITSVAGEPLLNDVARHDYEPGTDPSSSQPLDSLRLQFDTTLA
jgi:hypothetical protein